MVLPKSIKQMEDYLVNQGYRIYFDSNDSGTILCVDTPDREICIEAGPSDDYVNIIRRAYAKALNRQ